MTLTGKVLASAFGFVGDGTYADTMRLQAALDSGESIVMPPGVFDLVLSQTMQMEGGTTDCCLRIRPGYPGISALVPGRTVFRLKDGESTDANPRYFNMIGINEHVDGLLLEGCIQDLNGQNNPISPARNYGVYNKFNCAGLMVSGSVQTVGVDARLTNARIRDWKIINSPGVTAIALAQSNQVGTVLGQNIRITNCDFHNNGIDTDDHSSIYMWANDVTVANCRFDHPTMSSGIRGPFAAAELHGSDCRFENNTVKNYAWGVYSAGNCTSLSQGHFIRGNSFRVSKKAVDMFNETANEPGVNGVFVESNYIHLTAEHADGSEKRAISACPSHGGFSNIKISNNVLVTDDVQAAIGIKVGALASAKSVRNVDVSDNTIVGYHVGVSCGIPGVAGSTQNLKVKGNQITHVAPGLYYPTYTMGVYVCGQHSNLVVEDNASSGPYYGVILDGGAVTNLTMDGNYAEISTPHPISVSATVSGRRNGAQAQ